MKKIGYTSLVIGIIKLVGSGGSDTGIFVGIFMLLLGAFLIYKAPQKETNEEKDTTETDFDDDDYFKRLRR